MTVSPEQIAIDEMEFIRGLESRGIRPNKAFALEQQGWEVWLGTIFPFWFNEDYLKEHRKYWNLRWEVLMDIKAKRTPDPKKLTVLTPWGRGLGKSAVIEAFRIMRGAVLNGGYSLMVSETDDQAKEHLGNCRILIEHPDSKLLEYYPDMEISENATSGMPAADRREMFICRNGYILRAKGLTAKMRGLRVGTHRPNDIVFDDIDSTNQSIVVSNNKLRLITKDILPVQARENPTVDFAQNLISENSVMNQIYTGKTDALAERTVIGPVSAFAELHIDSKYDEEGKLRHTILDSSVPSWSGLNIVAAQHFLNGSGLDAFMSEYQNDFDRHRSGKVIPEYDEDRQIITWSQFESVYGTKRIPDHWNAAVCLDVGYSEGNHPHYSAWAFIATSAMNSKYPNKLFVYRVCFFTGTSIDDQAADVRRQMYERPRSWTMSHEKTGEMMVLNKLGMPFVKMTKFGKRDGIPQWRHLSRAQSGTNPFNGKEECDLYYIVDDDQLKVPFDDKGMHHLRRQISNWEYVPTKVTESGLTEELPSKIDDDGCDAVRGCLVYFGERAKALTEHEQVEVKVEELSPRTELQNSLDHADEAYRAHLISSQGILYDNIAKDMHQEEIPLWRQLG